MRTVNINEAKANFGQILEKASTGEKIFIDDDDGPAFMLVRVRAGKRRVRFGLLKGQLGDISEIEEALAAPLPNEVLAAFEGR
jgi:antitoxin (DNA-binding transcriptional repressor) of toxin-antitoxin stability system